MRIIHIVAANYNIDEGNLDSRQFNKPSCNPDTDPLVIHIAFRKSAGIIIAVLSAGVPEADYTGVIMRDFT